MVDTVCSDGELCGQQVLLASIAIVPFLLSCTRWLAEFDSGQRRPDPSTSWASHQVGSHVNAGWGNLLSPLAPSRLHSRGHDFNQRVAEAGISNQPIWARIVSRATRQHTSRTSVWVFDIPRSSVSIAAISSFSTRSRHCCINPHT